jgi:uncharacterized membrane protein YhhN
MTVFGIVAVVASVADWVSVSRRIKPLEYFAKPTATFAIGALAAVGAPPQARIPVIVAFGLCLAGDVLLMLPEDRFVGGLAAFLLGHAAFIVVFAQLGWGASWTPVVYGLAAGIAVATTSLARKIVPAASRVDERLALPIVAYILTIFAMFIAAVATGRLTLAIGAFAFMASDALIGFRRFFAVHEQTNVVIMVLYHSALGLLAAGIVT